MSKAKVPKTLREPDLNRFAPLDSDTFKGDEYYVYKDTSNGFEYTRRKIGGWVNLSTFFPLLINQNLDMEFLESELYKNLQYKKIQAPNNPRYDGIWVSLRDARTFSKVYSIEQYVDPILAFERIALVQYSGRTFWEFFACVNIDMNIRILRDSNSSRVNMKQIFVYYDKLKGQDAKVLLQERNFYSSFRANHPNEISEKNDHTLCGGFWVNHTIVKQYCKKHGILKIIKTILDFDSSPDQAGDFIVDKNSALQRRFWKLSACDSEFFGFPKSFSGGQAPQQPKALSKGTKSKSKAILFLLDEVVEKKSITSELTQQHNNTYYHSAVVRRFSDGWINGSSLVKVCCLLRVKLLDFGKDDPVMFTQNEIFYRDLVQKMNCEPVVSSRAPSLDGLWISGRDARLLFKEMMIEETELSRSVLKFLQDQKYEIPDDDDDDEDQVDVLDEQEFHSNISTSKPSNGTDFFVNESSSDEADLEEYHSDADDANFVAINDDGTGIHEVIEIEDNSDVDDLFDEQYTNDIKTEEGPSIPSQLPNSQSNNIAASQQLSASQGQQNKPQYQQGQQQQQSLYKQPSSNNYKNTNPMQVLQTRKRKIQELKDIGRWVENLLLIRAPTLADEKQIKNMLTTLEQLEDVDQKMIEESRVDFSLRKFKERFNAHNSRVQNLLSTWASTKPSMLPNSESSNGLYSRRPESDSRGSDYQGMPTGNKSAEYNNYSSYQYQKPNNYNRPNFPERQEPVSRTNTRRRFPGAPSHPYGEYGPPSNSGNQPVQQRPPPASSYPQGQFKPQNYNQGPGAPFGTTNNRPDNFQQHQFKPQPHPNNSQYHNLRQGPNPQGYSQIQDQQQQYQQQQQHPQQQHHQQQLQQHQQQQQQQQQQYQQQFAYTRQQPFDQTQQSVPQNNSNRKVSGFNSVYDQPSQSSQFSQHAQQSTYSPNVNHPKPAPIPQSRSKQPLPRGPKTLSSSNNNNTSHSGTGKDDGYSNPNHYKPSYQPTDINPNKRIRERSSTNESSQPMEFSKQRKISSNSYTGSESNVRTKNSEYQQFRAPSSLKFNYEMQKLINEDDLTYSQLKLSVDPVTSEQNYEVVKVSTGSELSDIIFNNEDVMRYRKLAHFQPIIQRREELLKRRAYLFSGTMNLNDENNKDEEDNSSKKVDFAKRLSIMITEKQLRKK